MKHLLALVFLFALSTAAFADNPPAVNVHQALDIAQKQIDDRGLDKEIYIESITFSRAAILGGETFWVVKYSHPITVAGENQQESGLKIRMNGQLTRLVHGFGKP